MKLLFVHQNLGDFGGAEANILLTAREMRHRGHSVSLMYAQLTSRNEAGWRQAFTNCYQLPTPGNVEVVEAVLESFAPDLVYLHNLPDLAIIEALLRSSAPVVRMVHDHSLYCMRGYKYNYFTRRICTRPASAFCVFPCLGSLVRNRQGAFPLKWASYSEKRREIKLNQRCHRLVVYSEHLKQELVRNGFEREKIELCVPISASEDGATSSLGPNNLILFAGQLIRGKGVDVLLQSLARVKAPFRCNILGDGNHRGYCEQLSARLGLAEKVHFQGYVPPAQLRTYYLEASVFVMSSLWPEPFGMAGPEAMRYGLPVVAFDAGGIKEWLRHGENGYCVAWKNTREFAARLEELLLNKGLARQMGLRGLEWVKQYDSGRQIQRLDELFGRVIEQARPPVPQPAAQTPVLSVYE